MDNRIEEIKARRTNITEDTEFVADASADIDYLLQVIHDLQHPGISVKRYAEIINLVSEHASLHIHRWQAEDNHYWLKRLHTEVSELDLALDGQHKDTIEHELVQIASIAINWLRKIKSLK